MDPATLSAARDAIHRAGHIVFFTGAGMSAESGIPTFRDALTGLWERFDPALLASAEGFESDPELVWGWYEWRRQKVMQAVPNAGHRAIAAFTTNVRPRAVHVVTQNVDDLHEKAGCRRVVHMHGELAVTRAVRPDGTTTISARAHKVLAMRPPLPSAGVAIFACASGWADQTKALVTGCLLNP